VITLSSGAQTEIEHRFTYGDLLIALMLFSIFLLLALRWTHELLSEWFR
jgi:type II secretory pathway component PulJ